MKHGILCLTLLVILSSNPCQAQSANDHLLSLDLSYLLTGLANQGGGIGLNYEKKLLNHLTAKGNVGHMTFATGIDNVYNTSVSTSLFVYYYPISAWLDKLYIGAGNGCDFMNYFGGGELPPSARDTLIHITPQIGWKLQMLRFVMLDISAGYKCVVYNTHNYNDIKQYVNPDLRIGLAFMLLFGEIKKGKNHEKSM